MKVKEFISYCIAGFIGGIIYEIVIYISDPYDPNWLKLLLRVAVISIGVALFVAIVKWLFGNTISANR